MPRKVFYDTNELELVKNHFTGNLELQKKRGRHSCKSYLSRWNSVGVKNFQ